MHLCAGLLWIMPLPEPAPRVQQPVGSIRGVVYDKDFGVPLPGAEVLAVESGQRALTSDQGNYVLADVRPGVHTLVFSKAGYVRQVRTEVSVTAGQLTEIDAWLSGDFTDMEEFVVQDVLQAGAGTESALLQLRIESPALIDSISADLMSRAGASDAAGALRLVAGASVQDGKYAVIRGLPDRYVSSQLNGVRLPTADEDKRAVELDQYPATVIESIQVSKTFTPDQQGDASGGAVDVRLRGIPEESLFQIKGQIGANSQSAGRSDFLTYDGGGVSFWGSDGGARDIQSDSLGQSWAGAVGTSTRDAPVDHKWSIDAGGKQELGKGVKLGGLASFFYERDSSFHDNGKNDSYWVANPGEGMTPETIQGTPTDGDFKTALFDITQGTQSVQWGGLGTIGLETEKHAIALAYLYTRTAEDTATLAENTRGKEYYFPGYDPDDPLGTGNEPGNLNASPYIRTETLEYSERSTSTLQLRGDHELPFGVPDLGRVLRFKEPRLDWSLSRSAADLNEPDKRQFGALWLPASFNPGVPPFVPPFTTDPTWYPYKPAANFNLGNVQRIWKEIEEDSSQVALDLKLPFHQWNDHEGYLKFGFFDDAVDRDFRQETFSNFGDAGASYQGGWDEPWSEVFPSENHPITESLFDVDYRGKQEITAWYGMMDLPLTSSVSAVGGARFESTDLGIVNAPEANATWFPPGATAPVTLNAGDADVSFSQDDVLPSLGLVYEPSDRFTVRAAYSQTIARQTFKELTPILQQEFLGGPIFIGNPDLEMSGIDNYDLRVDHTPYPGGLLSLSWFRKDVDRPIEYVQRLAGFTFTTPVNYPEGRLSGWELEARQDLGRWADALDGLSLGANATLISSEVTLPADEAAGFSSPGIAAPMSSRDMTNAPEHLYNAYLTYDLRSTRTQFALFYTIQGDTLVAGAGQANGNFVPNVYATQYDTLNFSLKQELSRFVSLQFQVKNLTNPVIEEVYRSEYIGGDVTKTSYTKGIDYTLSLTVRLAF